MIVFMLFALARSTYRDLFQVGIYIDSSSTFIEQKKNDLIAKPGELEYVNSARYQEKVAKEFLKFAELDPNVKPTELSIDDLKYITRKLKEFNGFKNPRGTSLSPLGEEIIEAGLKQILKPEFVTAVTRKPSAYSGHPFIVEVGIAYGGQIPPAETPHLYLSLIHI